MAEPELESLKKHSIVSDDGAPPRPPLPSSGMDGYYGRTGSRGQPQQHPPDTTDDESEDVFLNAPTPSQGPIMVRKFFSYNYFRATKMYSWN
jgi:hypothetical protein